MSGSFRHFFPSSRARPARGRFWCGGAAASALLLAAPAVAAPARIDIPATRLTDALGELARQTGVSVGAAGALPDSRTPAVHGSFSPVGALRRLLRGSGWHAIQAGRGVFRLEPDRSRALARHAGPAVPAIATAYDPDIIVTARKLDERLGNVPLSVSVIEAPGSLAGATLSTHDAIAESAATFTTNLGPGRDRIFLRGVADSPFNGPTQSTVSLFLDDARISYANPDPDLRLVDVSRIEVLRGPQGTLYGTGALGGIVRIVTNAPDCDRWSGSLAVEGSSVAHGAAGGAIDGVINVPLVRDRLGIRLVGYDEQDGGWIDDTGRSQSNVNRVSRTGGRIAIAWKPSADWAVDAGAAVQWIGARDTQYATGGLSRATLLAEPHDNDFTAFHLGVHGALGGLSLTTTTAYVDHAVDSSFDASAVAARLGLATPLGYREDRHLGLFTHESRLANPSARRPWVLGVAVLDADNLAIGTFRPAGAAQVPALRLHDHRFEGALFGEATQPFARHFSFTLGLRAFVSNEHGERQANGDRRATTVGATPSATFSWRPDSRKLIWLRYASAIRPGGLNPDATTLRGTFKSDELQSIELGWRIGLFRHALSLTGAIYGLRWDHLQSDGLTATGLVTTFNAGRANNYGVEIGSVLDLAPFRLDGGVTLQHARLTAAANGVSADPDRRLPVVPDVAARLRASVSVPLGASDLGAYVAGRYIGRTRLSFDPTLDRPMGRYASMDVGVSLRRGGWRASANLTNLLNERGNSFGFGNPFSIRDENQTTPLHPRTLTVRIERRF